MLFATVLSFAGLPTPAAAESVVPEVEPESLVGLRVKIVTRGARFGDARIDGKVSAVEGGTLLIQPRSNERLLLSVPVDVVDELEIHRRARRATKAGFVFGAATLGLYGGLQGAALALWGCEGHRSCNEGARFAIGFTVGAVVFGSVGGLIGALIGSLAVEDDWDRAEIRRVRTDLSFEPVRGGARVSLSLRF